MKTKNEIRNASFNFKSVEVLSSSQMNSIFGQGGTEEHEYIDKDGNYVYEIIIKK
jgi:hypothetical protein